MTGSWVDKAQLEFVFTGLDLTMTGVRPVGGTGGTRGDTKGTGRVSGSVLTSTFSWLVSYGSRKNAPVDGSLRFERE
ncbi:MAG: hypothetical protein AB7O52_17135 [Planctomycetota bacterium]